VTPDMQAIANRLDELEKQVAHLAALATEQSDTDREVVARGFVVKDAEGKKRAALGTHEHGPSLALFDANGTFRAGVGVTSKSSSIELHDGNGKCRMQLKWDGDGQKGPWIGLYDAEGRLRLDAQVEDGYGPMLILRDQHANPGVIAQVMEPGASVEVRHANSKRQAILEMSNSGTASLFMGEPGTQAQPAPGLSLKLKVSNDGPCLLFGKDNTVVWSAP
jgi:hypothetical protein